MSEESSCKGTAGKPSQFLSHIFATLFMVKRCEFSPWSGHAAQLYRKKKKKPPLALSCQHCITHSLLPWQCPLSKHKVSLVHALRMCSSQQGGEGLSTGNWAAWELRRPAGKLQPQLRLSVWFSAIWCRSTKVFCASVRVVTSQGNCGGNWANKGLDTRGDITGYVRIQLHKIPSVFLQEIIAKVVFWMILYSLALIPCL